MSSNGWCLPRRRFELTALVPRPDCRHRFGTNAAPGCNHSSSRKPASGCDPAFRNRETAKLFFFSKNCSRKVLVLGLTGIPASVLRLPQDTTQTSCFKVYLRWFSISSLALKESTVGKTVRNGSGLILPPKMSHHPKANSSSYYRPGKL